MFNSYNLNININLFKSIDNYENYSYFYKSGNKLILYKDNFITFLSLFIVTIAKFILKILLIDQTISITKKYKIERIKRNLASKSKIFSNNSKCFKYLLEIAY
ncbi:hypothetical protein C8035_v004835 [Colletotrichum spinosum]|uniref:Uncharacterized protein n=1 Tax=Colletotrichum spinosum TaxID=1347390 RepID=A0A4R8Q3G3_9PEZI|nr:hypothetical protein C8035_v004835 [Colletotrichum spinosum]